MYDRVDVGERKRVYLGIMVVEVEGEGLEGFVGGRMWMLSLVEDRWNMGIDWEDLLVGGINGWLLGKE